MLGRQPEDMTSLDMHDIMPQPFGHMHPKWMKVRACAAPVCVFVYVCVYACACGLDLA